MHQTRFYDTFLLQFRKKAVKILAISKKRYTFALAFSGKLIITIMGEMVEWSITVVLKTTVPRGTGGSNPSLSAKHLRNPL